MSHHHLQVTPLITLLTILLPSFTSTLSFKSTIMEEAPIAQREYVLCTLPFPEPTELIQGFRKSHPDIDISYVVQPFAGKPAIAHVIPDGKLPCLLLFYDPF